MAIDKKSKKKSVSKKKVAKKKTTKKSLKQTSKKTLKTVSKKKTSAKKAIKKTTSSSKKSSKKTAQKVKPKAQPIKKSASLSAVKLGSQVANFEVESTLGVFKLSDFKGKKLVLFFYPKDHTSGCTVEGNDFTNNLKKFKSKNTEVFGISRDSIKSHQSFIQKQNYKHQLISDPNEMLCGLFGVMKEKSMYGKKFLGVDRSTFLISEEGILLKEWRGVKVPGHVDQVLDSL